MRIRFSSLSPVARRSGLAIALALAIAAALAAAGGCGRGTSPANTTSPATASATMEAGGSAGAAGFPRTLTDPGGNTITLAAPPRRIVSQTLGTDEILFAICPRDRIVGLSTLARDATYSAIAAEAATAKLPEPSGPENIIRLRPDLVFVASYSRAETVELLRAGGAPVFRLTKFDSIDEILDNVALVGRAIGEEAAAGKVIADARARLAAARARIPAGAHPRIVSFTSVTTAGRDTSFDDIVRHAGAVNVAAEQGVRGFAPISAEQVLAWQPDFIVAGVSQGGEEATRRRLQADPALAATRAVRAGHIILIPNAALLSTSQHIVEAVERLVDALYGNRRAPATPAAPAASVDSSAPAVAASAAAAASAVGLAPAGPASRPATAPASGASAAHARSARPPAPARASAGAPARRTP